MEIKSNMDENLSLLPAFQNDYIGMAQDLRRMREYARKDYLRRNNWILYISIEMDRFCEELREFEDYCLSQ